MSQRGVDQNNDYNRDDEIIRMSDSDDDSIEEAMDNNPFSNTVTYSRDTGTFSMGDTHVYENLYDNTEDHEIDFANVHGLPRSQNRADRRRRVSASTERLVSSQLSQWNYNNNRSKLNDSIKNLRTYLYEMLDENNSRPIQVEPSLNDLEVLQLNLRIDGNYKSGTNPNDNTLKLNNQAMSVLLQSQIEKAMSHLISLEKRVDDVSSKVFITGDLNTGKSTFCNNLLRRHLLPEDQLPCTNVFCEILEARENGGIEEVHAIPLTLASSVKRCADLYDSGSSRTYERYPLSDLDNLVAQNEKYALLKIFIKDDKRPPEKSLLRNGIVNISLIDSPGLNMDSVQTSEVMARQEEIDLVVFVVNAENQLTLSAKEFIALASKEKKLMFFVVKKFDRIKDKERCKKLILEQIKDLSPETYKRSPEFVHFLSESPEENFSSKDDDPANSGSDDDNGDDDSIHPDPDFENLENSLRNFVLKRRSQSKLLPAKTFMCKVLSDITSISNSNLSIYKEEDDKIKDELSQLISEVDKIKEHYHDFTHSIDALSDSSVTDIYDYTKDTIMNCLDIHQQDLPQYPGISRLYDFIFQTEHYFKDQIKNSIVACELHARQTTKIIVDQICTDGRNELGDEFMLGREFDVGLMFSQDTHQLSKNFQVPLSINDLYAPSWNGLVDYLSWAIFSPLAIALHKKSQNSISDNKSQTSQSATTVNSILGLGNYPLTQYWKRPSLIFTSKLPALAIYSLGGSKIITTIIFNGISSFSLKSLGQITGSIVAFGSLLGVAYLIYDIPRALPQNLLSKYKDQLLQIDYIHTNAKRISNEVSEVLKTPTREIVKTCELIVDKKQSKQRELERKQQDNKISIQFFDQLLQKATNERSIVNAINLDVE
ncbi:mitofusin [Maudiozyma exigua]|uniref:Mitofusin n=1 Tax=Maudiozyma exigua TaxID=34358 RepID=A0A9P7BAX9_MAUEX|nr:mitofusin [Kazachstania exigua]